MSLTIKSFIDYVLFHKEIDTCIKFYQNEHKYIKIIFKIKNYDLNLIHIKIIEQYNNDLNFITSFYTNTIKNNHNDSYIIDKEFDVYYDEYMDNNKCIKLLYEKLNDYCKNNISLTLINYYGGKSEINFVNYNTKMCIENKNNDINVFKVVDE